MEEQSMDQVFLDRLTRIVDANLSNEQFGVQELAKQMGISRSQLHRKLRRLAKKSVSQFIREKRLKKAMDLLRQNVGTASEIAYQVGFSSPTYFTKCFHDYYGYPPGEVRRNKSVQIPSEQDDIDSKSFDYKKTLMLIITFSLMVSLIYFLFPQGDSFIASKLIRDEVKSKSIAVLPFKNLSGDKSNQYFADGIMEDILNRLSRINDLKVISRVSSDQYRESSKSLPQIADDLGVSYVLEGSIQKYKNETRIFVQLIEAESDVHLWSERYDGSFENYLSLQSDIARHVATELRAVITPEEEKSIENGQTMDQEAFKLYLQGRFFWNRRTEEGVKTSLKYFEQAVARDSLYALAYCGLADAYFILSWWGWHPLEDGYAKARQYAAKALSLDENLAEAHATIGAVAHWWHWDWETAEKELKKAIELNNNYATAHQYYAEYLSVQGNLEEAIVEMDKAVELNPLSLIMHSLNARYHYQVGRFDEAIELYQITLDMDNSRSGCHHAIARIYMEREENEKAVESLRKAFLIEGKSESDIEAIEATVLESGLQGFLQYMLNEELKKSKPNCYVLAQLYCELGQKEIALDWLEKCFQKGSVDINWIKFDCMIKNLRDEPRYITLLEKMGLNS
eukprot:TRINITY_DN1045_c1_g1_i2.p2 TRINITY_DN1045_c1_g1~~TRINITY_DN1045_c1_g1_i2.p2  ORF type:complete len:625 (-),score=56.29 TRINITY_DN1045_c1_g1_i2:1196-3070(-)